MSDKLVQAYEKSMKHLEVIWNRIGIGHSAKEIRSSAVLQHLLALLDEMVAEEVQLEEKILKKIAQVTEELQQLSAQLNVPEYKPPSSLAGLQLEKELLVKVETLRKEKKERLKILSQYKLEDQALCDAMCMTPYYIPSGTVPSGKQLEELKLHVESLTKEKANRFEKFIKQKKEIADLMLQMDRSPETSFEKEVVNEDEALFTLSAENMHALDALLAECLSSKSQLELSVANLWDKLNTLWERLDVPKHEQELFQEENPGFKPNVIRNIQAEIAKCEVEKLAHIQRFVEASRQDIETWWNKCYYSAKQRSDFKHFNDCDFTERLLELHEKELASVKEYYELHKDILQLVEKREVLFHKMVEFEKKANDPNRFFADRGGKLLLEEKERKALMRQLPKVEQTVKDDILLWEKEHGRTFLVNGLSFLKYIEKTWQDFEEAKEREKEERQKAKSKLMKEEMIFGSKPSTPVKRRFQPTTTPSKTPKYRKIDSTTSSSASGGSSLRVQVLINDSKTPGHTTQHHSTVYHSPYRKTPSTVTPASKILHSSSKTAPGSRNRRRSKRLSRKILREVNTGTNESVFSQSTISSGCNTNTGLGGNISLAPAGSYQDFSVGLNPSVRPHCRSSTAPQPVSPNKHMDHDRLKF